MTNFKVVDTPDIKELSCSGPIFVSNLSGELSVITLTTRRPIISMSEKAPTEVGRFQPEFEAHVCARLVLTMSAAAMLARLLAQQQAEQREANMREKTLHSIQPSGNG